MEPYTDSGGTYLDFMPLSATAGTGRRATTVAQRVLVVTVGAGSQAFAGTVQLRGPASLDARIVPSVPDNPASVGRATFRAAPTDFPTGFYDMTVNITGPSRLIPTGPDGRRPGSLQYVRKVWVQFDLGQQTAGSGSTTQLNHRGVVIGDPLSLELAFLQQFGSEYPQHMRLMGFERPGRRSRHRGAARLREQFALYLGSVKKYHGHLGQIRNAFHLVRAAQDLHSRGQLRGASHPREVVRRISRLSDADPTSQQWLRNFAELADVPDADVRIAMNHVMYQSMFENPRRDFLGHFGRERGFPRAGAGRAAAVLSHAGNVMDVLEWGINALRYGERMNMSIDAENDLWRSMRTMTRDDAFSLSRLAQIEGFRYTTVKQRAEAQAMLNSAPLSLLGWIPGPGWLTAAIAAVSFVANTIESGTRSDVVDWFEQLFNGWLFRSQFRQDLETRTYRQAFAGGDESHTAQRMMLQLSIRAKLLYNLRDLVQDNRPTEAEELIRWITCKDEWFIRKSLVFNPWPTFWGGFDGLQRSMPSGANPRDWIPVHFQEYFPIDFWCGDIASFVRWYRRDNVPEINLGFERFDIGHHRVTPYMHIRIRNFETFGFDRRVWLFAFFIEPAISDADVTQMQHDCDLFQRPWAQALNRKLSEISNRIDSVVRLQELRSYGQLLDLDDFSEDGRYHTSRTSMAFDLWSKNYLIMLCGQVGQRPVINKLLFACRPATGGVPMSYNINGDHLVNPISRVRFR